jgi:hypothetical protein
MGGKEPPPSVQLRNQDRIAPSMQPRMAIGAVRAEDFSERTRGDDTA